MHIRSFPGQLALRYPFFAPEDDDGADPFAEQPGDREEEPDEDPGEGRVELDPADVEGDADPDPEPEGEGDPDPEPAAAAEGEEEDEPAPDTRKDWRDRQIIKKNERIKQAEERAAAAEAKAAALEALYAKPEAERGEGEAAITRDEARKEALEVVRREQYFEKLNTSAEAMYEAGQKAFPKTWAARVQAAGEVFSDEMRTRPDFIEAVTGLDNSAAVYHHLAGDPDKMEALLRMPPVKLGMELSEISRTVAAKPVTRVSKVPPPIVPLERTTVTELPLEDPRVSQEEFNRRMDAEEERRYAAKRR